MINKYVKKPVVIEAVQFTGTNLMECLKFIKQPVTLVEGKPSKPHKLFIDTLEGKMEASVGDFIIKGVNGEFYPCKPDIFEKSYEILEEEKDCVEVKAPTLIEKLNFENIELRAKIEKLDNFTETEEFIGLPRMEQFLLLLQLETMEHYSTILEMRIFNLEEKND